MSKVFSWIKNVGMRQVLTVFLVAVTVFFVQSFGFGNAIQAQADTVRSPEGIYYKGTPDYKGNIDNNELGDKAKQKLKETTDNLRENLNPNGSVTTPEGTYYKARPDYPDYRSETDNADNVKTGNIFEKAKQNLQETAENVKDKLNLDEPVPQSTRDFFRADENRLNRLNR